MNYVIIAPNLLTTSAGIVGLHKLNKDLNNIGQTSRIISVLGPHGVLNTNNILHTPILDNEIVIYPDCYSGNPFKAKNVIRYLMMFAGYFGEGTDKDFPDSEYMYYYSPEFLLNDRNAQNILSIPVVNEYKFKYNTEGRSGFCCIARKFEHIFGGKVDNLPSDCVKIYNDTDVKKLFETKKTLITYDYTALHIEALLSGMEVECRFNKYFESPFIFGDYWDWNNVITSYSIQKELYWREQLPLFVERTQKHFSRTV